MATDQTPTNDQTTPAPATREREVIVTNNGTPSNSVASTVLAIVGMLVVLLVGWFAIQAFTGDGDGFDVPQEFDINIQDGDAPAPAPDGN